MKAKLKLLSIAGIGSLATIIAIAASNFSNQYLITDAANKKSLGVTDEKITFDYSHGDVVTKYGNIITTSATGYFQKCTNNVLGYFGKASSDGKFYIDNPFQSISSVKITWSASNSYELYFYVGSAKGSSDCYNSGNLVSILKGQSKTTNTLTISNPSYAHYVTVDAKKFDSTTKYNIYSIEVTYSCN